MLKNRNRGLLWHVAAFIIRFFATSFFALVYIAIGIATVVMFFKKKMKEIL